MISGRHGLGDLVAQPVRVAQHPGRVAHRGPGLDGGEGDDLGDAVPAVALGRVADHLVPVAGVEVHVDVRHGDAGRVEEALEQQVVLDRVQVGDAQAVGHAAAGGAAPAGADADVVVPGVLDQVPDDEEVRREPHVVDDLELEGDPVDDLVAELLAPALLGPLQGEVEQVGPVVGEALGQGELGQQRLAELDLDVAALGDQQRVVARPRVRLLGEEPAHLVRGLEVVLLAVELEAGRVAHHRVGLDAQQGVVGLGVLPGDVVAVVGGQQRGAQLAADLQQAGHGLALLVDPVVLDLDEEVVLAEDVLQAPGPGEGLGLVALEQGLEHVAAQAARGGDQALAVLVEQVPVDAGLVEVALQEGPAGQLDHVPVAGAVLGQQDQVVVELAAALGVAARVVQPAPAGGALRAVLVGHVGLGADDRRDVRVAAGLVEVQDPVHVPVVRDGQGGLSVRLGRGDGVTDPRRPVQHRELGVVVEVDEGHVAVGDPQAMHRLDPQPVDEITRM